MANITELAAEIVSAHAATTPMSTDEIIQELYRVHASLKALESGQESAPVEAEPVKAAISLKDAFKKNEVVCLECGKKGFKTLTRHLNSAHGMTPKEYRKAHNIPTKQPLSAKSLTDARRKSAQERNLSENLVKARAARVAKQADKNTKTAKSAKTAKKK